MMKRPFTRRELISASTKAGGALFLASAIAPLTGVVDVVEAKTSKKSRLQDFRFVVIGDTHLYEMPNHRFDKTFQRAVQDVNAMSPKPDFVIFIGDLAQFGKRTELEKGYNFLKSINVPYRIIPGEHDWYLDMGEMWKKMFGSPFWSFDHKGVHFIGMNSILVRDYWSMRNMTPEERMNAIAELECHICGLWGVREEQLEWLEKDVKNLRPDTPIVIITHSPLWDYYPRWNFQTEDAPQIRSILSKFEKVIAIHGHVHQVVFNKIGNMVSIGNLATAWPWPYPDVKLPYPEIVMNRVDPGDIFDGVGFMHVDLDKSFTGKAYYDVWANLIPTKVKQGVKL